MTIIEENGKREIIPDGISSKWYFVGKGIGMILGPRECVDEEESESDRLEDAFAKEGGFECRGTHSEYIATLRTHNIFLLMPEEVNDMFHKLLSALAKVIRENTNRPATARRQIGALVKEYSHALHEIKDIKDYDPDTDEYATQNPYEDDDYIWKTIIKVLALQGVYRWMTGFGIRKRDNGYGEYCAIQQYIKDTLFWELVAFCHIHIPDYIAQTDPNNEVILDDDARKRNIDKGSLRFTISYLSDYFANTYIGGEVKNHILRHEYEPYRDADGADTKTEGEQPKKMPRGLDTEEARFMFEKAIEAGFFDKTLHWNSSRWKDGKDMIALACFVYKASAYLRLGKGEKGDNKIFTSWLPFEKAIHYDKQNGSNSQIRRAKTDAEMYGHFDGSDEMKEIERFFESLP